MWFNQLHHCLHWRTHLSTRQQLSGPREVFRSVKVNALRLAIHQEQDTTMLYFMYSILYVEVEGEKVPAIDKIETRLKSKYHRWFFLLLLLLLLD